MGTGFDQSLLRLPHGGSSILPVPESDMIYAVITNELGLVGATALLLVYLLFVARGLKTAMLARDSFSKLLATGLSFIVAMQVFVIVGGVTRRDPADGRDAAVRRLRGLLRGDELRAARAPAGRLRSSATALLADLKGILRCRRKEGRADFDDRGDTTPVPQDAATADSTTA